MIFIKMKINDYKAMAVAIVAMFALVGSAVFVYSDDADAMNLNDGSSPENAHQVNLAPGWSYSYVPEYNVSSKVQMTSTAEQITTNLPNGYVNTKGISVPSGTFDADEAIEITVTQKATDEDCSYLVKFTGTAPKSAGVDANGDPVTGVYYLQITVKATGTGNTASAVSIDSNPGIAVFTPQSIFTATELGGLKFSEDEENALPEDIDVNSNTGIITDSRATLTSEVSTLYAKATLGDQVVTMKIPYTIEDSFVIAPNGKQAVKIQLDDNITETIQLSAMLVNETTFTGDLVWEITSFGGVTYTDETCGVSIHPDTGLISFNGNLVDTTSAGKTISVIATSVAVPTNTQTKTDITVYAAKPMTVTGTSDYTEEKPLYIFEGGSNTITVNISNFIAGLTWIANITDVENSPVVTVDGTSIKIDVSGLNETDGTKKITITSSEAYSGQTVTIEFYIEILPSIEFSNAPHNGAAATEGDEGL